MTIKVYGTNWCGSTRRVLEFLDSQKIHYQYIDIDIDSEASDFVKAINRGNRSVPTLLFDDGSTLTEPSNVTLTQRLNKQIFPD